MSSYRLQGSDKNAQILAKRYADHTFDDEEGEEYSASTFGDFATYMQHKKAKLQNRNSLLRSLPENRDKPQIFCGVVATVNGYTRPSLQDLTEMIVTHGGIFLQYMDGKTSVTHIIASALTPKKMVEFEKYRVVKPAWVVECIKEGKLLPWEQWRVIPEGSRQSKLGFVQSQSVSPTNPGRVGLVSQRPRRSIASYKEVTTPGRATPSSTPGKLLGRGSVISSPSAPAPKWPPSISRSSSSLHSEIPDESDIPDGKSFAIVIPKSRSVTPKTRRSPEKKESRLESKNESEARDTSIQDCIWVGGKQYSKINIKSLSELYPFGELPPHVPLSPHDIPPSHQPERPSDSEPPTPGLPLSSSSPQQPAFPSDYEVPESSPPLNLEPDEKFIVSFTKSEGDEVEKIMQALGDGEIGDVELPSSQTTVVDNEDGKSTPRRPYLDSEIPPSDDDIESGSTTSEGLSDEAMTNPASPVDRLSTTWEVKIEIPNKLENVQAYQLPSTPRNKRPSPSISPSRASPTPSKKLKISNASTSEEANAALLANPRVRSATVLNPDFLKQYYQESRLHHLSAWKAELKQKLQELTQNCSVKNSSITKSRRKYTRRYVLHIDFDCFFAAISTRNHHADLTGKPVAVTHGKGNERNVSSEIASCNYKARESGVKNGMWMGRALELCPGIICLPYDFPAYEEASREFYSVMLELGADVVQSVSVDEALVDVTSLCYGVGKGSVEAEQTHADALARTIRDRVREKTRCDVSVGIGGNILLAKLALRKAKPAGQYHLKPDKVLGFLGDLSLRDLPGVGNSLAGRLLEELNITKVKDLSTVSKERLQAIFGEKTGEKLYNYAHGIDPTEVGDMTERKSVSADVSWGVRFETQVQAEEFLQNLAGELHRRLVEARVKGKQLTIKVLKRAKDAPVVTPKFLGRGECDAFTKSVALGVATWDQGILGREAIAVLRGYKFPPVELRGLGLQMTKLEKVKSMEEMTGGQKRLGFKPAPTPVVKQEEEQTHVKQERSPLPSVLPSPPVKASPTAAPTAGPWAFMPPPTLSRPMAAKKPSSPGYLPPSSQFLVPSASQIDPSVLDALPSPMRAGILAAMSKQSSANNTTTAGPARHNQASISPPPPRTTVPSVPPSLPKAGPSKVPPPPIPKVGPSKQPSIPLGPPDLILSASQIDPDFLASLTPTLREEILSEYRGVAEQSRTQAHHIISPRKNKGKGKEKQTLLPQSPRKPREWIGKYQSKAKESSRSRSRNGSRAESPAAGAIHYDMQPRTLFPQPQHRKQQLGDLGNGGNTVVVTYTPIINTSANNTSNKLSQLKKGPPQNKTQTRPPPQPQLPDSLPPGLDPTVLASLPPDILAEVLAHHRREQQQQKQLGALAATTAPINQNQLLKLLLPNPLHPPPSTRCLKIPQHLLPRPTKKPHLQHVSALEQVREVLEEWIKSSTTTYTPSSLGATPKVGAENRAAVRGSKVQIDGPNEEDVLVLINYLRDVVVIERDLEKAMRIVEWFGLVVEEVVGLEPGDSSRTQGAREWKKAVVRAGKEGVGRGCRERGIPEVGFEFGF